MSAANMKKVHFAKNILFAAIAACAAGAYAADAPNALPAPGPARKASIPASAEKTLANGLRIVVATRRATPLVTTALYLRSGAEVDPPRLSGLAAMTAGLLDKGTATRSAPQIAEAADALGGSIGTGAGWDSSSASITVTTPKLAAALDLIADIVLHPKFAQEEIDRLRKQSLDSLQLELSEPQGLAALVARRAVFGDGAYGHPADGTVPALPRITRADIVRLHDTYYRPDNALLVFAGDIDLDQAAKLAESAFGAWKNPATALPAPRAASGPSTLAASVVVDLPGTGQAAVALAHAGIARDAADYYAGLVANAVLGGGYSSRLNQEIRIKRGLSYGAGSALATLRHGGAFVANAQTKNPSAVEVAGLMYAELDRLGASEVPADEFAARKATLAGNYAFGLETTGSLAARVAGFAVYGQPLSELGAWPDKVQAVTPAQVQAFARTHLGRDGATLVVAGDAGQFAEALATAYPNTMRFEADKIDFDSADLKAVAATKNAPKK
ncbi:pitrilysin family protein [Rudaea sp.]|uniref:M16 family metallopeptidase n=1 Tax=Rudaea sp. TaxID=2136325 RepID=UPI0032209D4B